MTVTGLDPDQLASLEEQRDFLLRSLADLEREHEAGDLDDDDFAALRDDYTARAAETLRALDEQRAAFAQVGPRAGAGRRAAVLGGVALFAVVAAFAVASSLGARGEGETSSGGITVKQTASQRANQCIQLISPQAPKDSLDCFGAVLADDPENVVALTWGAWQLSLAADLVPDQAVAAGVRQRAATQLTQAVGVKPDYSPARAFRAVVAYRNGEFKLAKDYLAEFEDNNPSADSRQTIDQMNLPLLIDEALAEVGDVLPDGGTGTGTTVTTAVPGD